ncbi:uncharacterized protein MAM_03737 [Metarhizium album ARSEF 1941]|uniref:Uncharacterized protein n=1 Tax=Metarhizium album (strain ARSEF 1941) TaxID=1081103 RepID=A0A0B2WX27_METAS|nr:uncharacterized protein MAM_03737 [Metarhizium album ARSEF 1941]KHN98613.1 hypothetical protein MAM_03737 [Metarhizium album ARSEF 1941]
MPGLGNKGSLSSSWGRLKPVEQDPLQSMGLPSKGDTRLLDLKIQEKFYTIIVDKYMAFCSDAGQRDELLRRLSSLHIDAMPTSDSHMQMHKYSNSSSGTSRFTPCDDTSSANELSGILAALRKLREGIVASKRTDNFAAQVYLFCIRLSVLAKQPESYHAAILHLLRTIHARHPLTSLELQEVVGYLVLDTACRRRQVAEAIAIRHQFKLHDDKVNAVLQALIHDNYVLFRQIQKNVDGHKARLMEWVERDIRIHTLKCFGRTYFSVDLQFLEEMTASNWEDLTNNDGVGWELDEQRVVIRKVRAR